MENCKKRFRGFAITELLITLSVVCVLGAFAWPAYKNFQRRTYYSDVLSALEPFKTGVTACFQDTHNLTKCNGGHRHIPANIVVKKGVIASLTVSNGVITATPVSSKGVLSTDIYILTPSVNKNNLTWAASGAAVEHRYAE